MIVPDLIKAIEEGKRKYTMNKRIKELAEQAKFMAEETINKQISYNTELKAFDEKFAELIVKEYASEYTKLINGEAVVLPKDREHAEALVRVGMFYLENNK